jgi:hypothetical protein
VLQEKKSRRGIGRKSGQWQHDRTGHSHQSTETILEDTSERTGDELPSEFRDFSMESGGRKERKRKRVEKQETNQKRNKQQLTQLVGRNFVSSNKGHCIHADNKHKHERCSTGC